MFNYKCNKVLLTAVSICLPFTFAGDDLSNGLCALLLWLDSATVTVVSDGLI